MGKKILYGALAYFLVSFALGVSWHFVFFKDLYHALGAYNRQEPIIPLGITSMLAQGIILAYLFPYYYQGNAPIKEGLIFSWIMGLYMYTLTTINFAAKSEVSSITTWFLIQAAFHFLQFTLTGLFFGMIFAAKAAEPGELVAKNP